VSYAGPSCVTEDYIETFDNLCMLLDEDPKVQESVIELQKIIEDFKENLNKLGAPRETIELFENVIEQFDILDFVKRRVMAKSSTDDMLFVHAYKIGDIYFKKDKNIIPEKGK